MSFSVLLGALKKKWVKKIESLYFIFYEKKNVRIIKIYHVLIFFVKKRRGISFNGWYLYSLCHPIEMSSIDDFFSIKKRIETEWVQFRFDQAMRYPDILEDSYKLNVIDDLVKEPSWDKVDKVGQSRRTFRYENYLLSVLHEDQWAEVMTFIS
jgi:hypothetical protein